MMPSGERRYGVQVGDETYSLIITQEDWEKRRIDRERARKLSLETNRRRKALEEKKKLANERENRKRELELAKRRQRQIEATERYQRSHVGTRERQNYIIEPFQTAPTVESVLQELRSGDNAPIPSTGPDYAGSATSAEAGKYKFEVELEEQKNKVLENHRKITMQEFSEQLHSNGGQPTQSTPAPSGAVHAGPGDATRNRHMQGSRELVQDYDTDNSNAKQPASYSYSNVDIMSGRTYPSFRPVSPQQSPVRISPDSRSTPPRSDMPNPSGAEPKTLAESLSRLFVGHQTVTPNHTEHKNQHMKLEEADETIQDSLDCTHANAQQQATKPEKVTNSSVKSYNADDFAHDMYYRQNNDAVYDDQDSLHGSSSSGTSPRPSSHTMNITSSPVTKGHVPNVNMTPAESNGKAMLGSQLFRSREAGLPNKFTPKTAEGQVMPHTVANSVTDSTRASTINENARLGMTTAQSRNIVVANSAVRSDQPGGKESPKTPISYYIKAYRPWSANSSRGNEAQQSHGNSSLLVRPNSAYEPRRSKSTDPKFSHDSNKVAPVNFHPVDHESARQQYGVARMSLAFEPARDAPNLVQTNKWASNGAAKTTATPISAMYNMNRENDGREHESNSGNGSARSVVLLARQAIPPTPAVNIKPSATKLQIEPPKPTDVQMTPQNSEMSRSTNNSMHFQGSNKPVSLKGILRRGSKYDMPASGNGTPISYPAYQAAGVARQKWVNGINVGPSLDAKLRGTNIRDSLDVARRSSSATESEPKSVRWHQVQYNDGTTSALDNVDDLTGKIPPPPPSPVVVPQKPSGPRIATPKPKPPKTPPAPKAKPPARNVKGGKGKNARGRKLKPAKEVPTEIEPHPPEKKTKQLSMSTVINYSIDGEEKSNDATECKAMEEKEKAATTPSSQPVVSKPILSPTRNKIMFHQRGKVAWEAPESEEAVTMKTLKSAGNRHNGGGNVLVNQGNQVTIHVVSPERTVSSKDATHNHSPISLNRTPTDQEINWLWDKVRACLAHKSGNGSPMVRKSASDTGRQNIYARKNAWNSTSLGNGGQQTSANIISIDGGMLGGTAGQERNPIPGNTKAKGKRGGRRLMRPSSAITMQSSIQRQATDAYNSYVQRHGMLLRRQRHVRGQRTDGVRSATYPAPKSSMYQPAPPASAGSHSGVTDSMTTFLLAETLAEQNIPEEQILQALESLQRKTKEAQRLGRQMLPSSLSMEEQKLLASLERLNTRLQEVQTTNPYSNHSLVPSQTTWTDYSHVPENVPASYMYSRGRTASADSVYRNSRIRY